MYDKLLSVVNVRHTNKYLNRCLLQIGDDSDEKGNSDGVTQKGRFWQPSNYGVMNCITILLPHSGQNSHEDQTIGEICVWPKWSLSTFHVSELLANALKV